MASIVTHASELLSMQSPCMLVISASTLPISNVLQSLRSVRSHGVCFSLHLSLFVVSRIRNQGSQEQVKVCTCRSTPLYSLLASYPSRCNLAQVVCPRMLQHNIRHWFSHSVWWNSFSCPRRESIYAWTHEAVVTVLQ